MVFQATYPSRQSTRKHRLTGQIKRVQVPGSDCRICEPDWEVPWAGRGAAGAPGQSTRPCIWEGCSEQSALPVPSFFLGPPPFYELHGIHGTVTLSSAQSVRSAPIKMPGERVIVEGKSFGLACPAYPPPCKTVQDNEGDVLVSGRDVGVDNAPRHASHAMLRGKTLRSASEYSRLGGSYEAHAIAWLVPAAQGHRAGSQSIDRESEAHARDGQTQEISEMGIGRESESRVRIQMQRSASALAPSNGSSAGAPNASHRRPEIDGA